MKVSKGDYAVLEAAILTVLASAPDAYAKYQAAGASDRRFMWDVFHATKIGTHDWWRKYTDAHTETALRKALRPHMQAEAA